MRLASLLLNPTKAERHPFEVFILVFIYTSISIFLAMWILPSQASLAMVFFSVIACLYIAQSALIVEEAKEDDTKTETTILQNHFKILRFFLVMFLGFLAAFTFWTLVLPENTIQNAFSVQAATLQEIQALTITGRAVAPDAFQIILANNFRVLLLSLLLALFYGAGAIFILAWNASIMGFIIGDITRNAGLTQLPYAFLKFSLHGIPEMFAYLMAALAGSILFMALVRGDFKQGNRRRIITDVIVITFLSALLIVIAAAIEAFISINI